MSASGIPLNQYPTRFPQLLSMPLVGDVLCSAVVHFRSKRRIQRERFQWVTTPLGDVLCPALHAGQPGVVVVCRSRV
jgi:hypothetical protein